MEKVEQAAAASAAGDVANGTTVKIDEAKGKRGLEVESERKRAIDNLSKANKIADSVRDAWIDQGYSLEQVSKDLLQI